MKQKLISTIFFLMGYAGIAYATSPQDYAKQRARMIQEILSDVEWTRSYTGKEKFNPKVMEVMARTPRHEFVPDAQKPYAYLNRPLPIGYGQTISQPYIVALMTDLLEVKPSDRILELGTGSGYQAAILSPLAKEVYTIEIIPALGEAAQARFERLGFKNIKTRVGDGYYGWKESAPFDGIMVTAASNHIPPPLLEQLKPGGRMVIPLGGPFSTQQLVLVEKDMKGNFVTRQILPVQFVPLQRDH